MTERKTLNRYYPVDYDPSKIPKLKQSVKEKNRLWGIRVMAPFNMKCNTCGEYIYKGKKFNSKKETVENQNYLGIQLHRFYIRCPKCIAVIAFKTDPENCDYELEAGATRNFEAAKTLHDMMKKEQAALDEEEANNPMKVLENRMKQSQNEMGMIETLQDLQETKAKHSKLDKEAMIFKLQKYQEAMEQLQDEEDEKTVRAFFNEGKPANGEMIYKRLPDPDTEPTSSKSSGAPGPSKKRPMPPPATLGTAKASKKSKLSGLVKKASTATSAPSTATSAPSTSTSCPSTSTSCPSTSTSGPSTSAQGPSTSASGPSTSASCPSTSASGPSTSASCPSTSTSGPSTSASCPSTSTSCPSTSAQGPSTSASGSSTSAQGPSTSASGPSTANAVGSLGFLCGYSDSEESD